MIINSEKGRQVFGNAEDIFQNELLNFANLSAPRHLEGCVNAHLGRAPDTAIDHLQALLGSARLYEKHYICGEARILYQRVPGAIGQREGSEE